VAHQIDASGRGPAAFGAPRAVVRAGRCPPTCCRARGTRARCPQNNPTPTPDPSSVGLLANAAGDREFRRALNDLNHRLRNALGEYDEPREPMPVP
jgi:hypothetical protein